VRTKRAHNTQYPFALFAGHSCFDTKVLVNQVLSIEGAGMTHKTILGKRGVTHYWTAGDSGPTVVFTHGAIMDHGLFKFQMDYFSQRYRVISWDVPSHGLSRPCERFSLRNAADDLLAILDAEEAGPAHLVGQSMGGYISQIAAVGCPDKVRTITAVGSSPIQLSYYSALDRRLLSIAPSLLRLYPYSTLVDVIAKRIAISAPARAYALEMLKTYTKVEIVHMMGALYGGLLEDDQATLSCPVLVVYGDQDRTGKVRDYSECWAKREGRRLEIIPDAAHNANMDNPKEFNRVLSEFLDEMPD
jgi:pimeloyl-ACP methyl ester carboxylesterase